MLMKLDKWSTVDLLAWTLILFKKKKKKTWLKALTILTFIQDALKCQSSPCSGPFSTPKPLSLLHNFTSFESNR